MDLRNTLILLIFIFFLVTLANSQNPPSFPQEFEGTVEINNGVATEGRTVIAKLEDSTHKTEVGSDGSYSVVVSGEGEIDFFTENATGGLVEAETVPENPTYESGGPAQKVNLSFSIESPQPQVTTGEVVEKEENYTVLKAETRFIDNQYELFFDYNDSSSSYTSQSKNIDQGGSYEIRIENLDYNTKYSYRAVLQNQETFTGSQKSFQTDNKPPFRIEGRSNITSGYAEAKINGKIIDNSTLSSDGSFRFDITYNTRYKDKEVDIKLRDKEKTLRYISGKTSYVNFNFTKNQVDNQEENQTETQRQQDQNRQEEQTQQEEDQQTNDEDIAETSISEESEDNNSTPTDSNLATGQFYQNQVNGITYMLFIGLGLVGIYLLKA